MATHQICRWHRLDDADALETAASTRILQAAAQSIARRGVFHLVLAGGSTPRRIYHALRAASTDWTCWQVWFGDERCLPPDHPERNSRMAADAWLDHVAVPPAQVRSIPAELGAIAAADAYARTLSGMGDFDLVLLGLGEDGHTASLFPNHDWGMTDTAPATLAVFDAPKPPPERVSLSAHRLSAARSVLFLVSGTGKRAAVAAWQAGERIPAAAITPATGVDILLDFSLGPT